jgi:hypothetical protein
MAKGQLLNTIEEAVLPPGLEGSESWGSEGLLPVEPVAYMSIFSR